MKTNRIIAAVIAAGLLSVPAAAQGYIKGSDTCNIFEEVKERYASQPDKPLNGAVYGLCLILKGEDLKGLNLLHHLVDDKNNIYAAHIIARYKRTQGQFDESVNHNELNSTIEAYQRVLSLIDWYPAYPEEYEGSERGRQTELVSHYFVSYLYFFKVHFGFVGSNNQFTVSSPSYDSNKKVLLFPQYSPYTLDSLERLMRFSNRCLSLPKKNHFDNLTYQNVKKVCGVLKDFAHSFIAQERERLRLLSGCSEILDCPGYVDLAFEMNESIHKTKQQVHRLNSSH